jgi:glycosyltransferase involved in cell wall biosynthesis
MDKYQVAIVIPAFNEESTISNVVHSVKEYGVVVVVDDASTDNTKKMAKEAGAVVVSHNENKGYDGALNSGFVKAEELNFDAIITFDADGQHDFTLVPIFIDKLKSGYSLVLGVRDRTQRISEWFFKVYTGKKYKWKDPLCGMKGYSMLLYKKQGFFDSYQSIGTELSLFGLVNNERFCEIPIKVHNRSDKPRFSSLIRSNIIIIKSLLVAIKGAR